MSLYREDERDRQSDITFQCDLCGAVLETETGDFNDARDCLSDQGWRAVKEPDGSWGHRCPDCVGRR